MTWFVVFDISNRNLIEDTLCFYIRTPELSPLSKEDKDWVFLHTLGCHFKWGLCHWDRESGVGVIGEDSEVCMLDYWEEDPTVKPHVKVLVNTLYGVC